MLQTILNSLSIPHSEDIRGNITLPTERNGATITWTSSNPAVISDRQIGKKEAGVVTRGDSDVKVTLSATVTFPVTDSSSERTSNSDKAAADCATKTFELTVKKSVKKPDASDFTGYLFGHFIGEEDENGEQIYFSLSEDGMHFKDLNKGKPVLVSTVGERGVRDPYLYRSFEGDRYFLIATDLSIFHRGGWFINEQNYYDASTTGSDCLVLWESNDLVTWSEPRLLKVAPKNAGMAWAPEMIYDEETGNYVIYFSSSIMNPETKYKSKPNTIYYVTTRDFVTFSETKIFIDNQTDGETDGKRREIIDTTLIKVGDFYYSASKDGDNAEENGGIRIMKNRSLLNADGWEKVLDLDELALDMTGFDLPRLDNGLLEGPELFLYNRKDWADKNVPEYGLIADQYATGNGYLPFTTTDLEDAANARNSWKLLSPSEYSFDKLKKRHGTIFNLTKDELDRIKAAF